MNQYRRLADSVSKAPIAKSVGNAPIENSVGKAPTEDSAGKTPMVKVAVHKAQRAIEKLF